MLSMTEWFNLNRLSELMIGLVILIGLSVASFAFRYMKGDSLYRGFYRKVALLIMAICIMVMANQLLILFLATVAVNLIIIRLMIHKKNWGAAFFAGQMAKRYHYLSAVCLGLSFALLFYATGESHINLLLQTQSHSVWILPALLLLLIAIMIQSAIWPFQGWLANSLNSPTPVSALMHAGVVNGGGFLLIRFSPLYLHYPSLLEGIFILAIFSTLLGTAWKLIQPNIKGMLAYSTMGQMGFMLLQCGLGLFAAAIAHLVLHGLFKAYLFLASGSTAKQSKLDFNVPQKGINLILGSGIGIIGMGVFMVFSHNWDFSFNTQWVLFLLIGLSSTQLAWVLLEDRTGATVTKSILLVTLFNVIYGESIRWVTRIIQPLNLSHPLSLNPLYCLGMALLMMAWLFVLVFPYLQNSTALSNLGRKVYVLLLNLSQPWPKTSTPNRNNYTY